MQISTQNLRKIYQKKNVVDDVSISVGKGEVVGLLGPNGAGKTTTFYMVVGLVRPDEGRILLGDRDITDLPMHLRAREGIGYLAQEPSVFRKLTVEDNIMAVLEVMKLPFKQRKTILESLLAEFRIEHIRNRFGYMLSGGERRRVEIARALAISPSFILLDEPFAGVDPISVMDIQEIISHLKTKGLGVLITDHNVRETLAITDRAYIIHQGKILEAGSAEHITNSEIAKKFYLGEKFTL